MACVSPDLKEVADKSGDALAALQQLEESVKQQNAANVEHFEKEIQKVMKDARLKDGRLIEFTSNVKTEYSSEFSIDKITNVVKSTLKAVSVAKGGSGFSDDAVAAYCDVVNLISEAAKSKSASTSDLTFQYHRLMPGVLVFLYAKSTSLSDSKLFGNQTVCSTVIYHKIMESPEDVQYSAVFDATTVDAFNYLQIKKLQKLNGLWLEDHLFDEDKEIENEIAVFERKDKFLTNMAKTTLERLASNGYNQFDKLKEQQEKAK